MALDGFVAGPNPRTDAPLGDGGERLHDWAYGLKSFHERHNMTGGTQNQDSDVLAEAFDNVGAQIMGRGMFGGGPGPWEESWTGWWGDDPPFRMPVFVLTHHPREPLQMQGGTSFTFGTDASSGAREGSSCGGTRTSPSGRSRRHPAYVRPDSSTVPGHVTPILSARHPRRATNDLPS